MRAEDWGWYRESELEVAVGKVAKRILELVSLLFHRYAICE